MHLNVQFYHNGTKLARNNGCHGRTPDIAGHGEKAFDLMKGHFFNRHGVEPTIESYASCMYHMLQVWNIYPQFP